jgi:hypothetical protein
VDKSVNLLKKFDKTDFFKNEIAIPVGVLSQKLGAKAPAQKKVRPRSMRGGGSRLGF